MINEIQSIRATISEFAKQLTDIHRELRLDIERYEVDPSTGDVRLNFPQGLAWSDEFEHAKMLAGRDMDRDVREAFEKGCKNAFDTQNADEAAQLLSGLVVSSDTFEGMKYSVAVAKDGRNEAARLHDVLQEFIVQVNQFMSSIEDSQQSALGITGYIRVLTNKGQEIAATLRKLNPRANNGKGGWQPTIEHDAAYAITLTLLQLWQSFDTTAAAENLINQISPKKVDTKTVILEQIEVNANNLAHSPYSKMMIGQGYLTGDIALDETPENLKKLGQLGFTIRNIRGVEASITDKSNIRAMAAELFKERIALEKFPRNLVVIRNYKKIAVLDVAPNEAERDKTCIYIIKTKDATQCIHWVGNAWKTQNDIPNSAYPEAIKQAKHSDVITYEDKDEKEKEKNKDVINQIALLCGSFWTTLDGPELNKISSLIDRCNRLEEKLVNDYGQVILTPVVNFIAKLHANHSESTPIVTRAIELSQLRADILNLISILSRTSDNLLQKTLDAHLQSTALPEEIKDKILQANDPKKSRLLLENYLENLRGECFDGYKNSVFSIITKDFDKRFNDVLEKEQALMHLEKNWANTPVDEIERNLAKLEKELNELLLANKNEGTLLGDLMGQLQDMGISTDPDLIPHLMGFIASWQPNAISKTSELLGQIAKIRKNLEDRQQQEQWERWGKPTTLVEKIKSTNGTIGKAEERLAEMAKKEEELVVKIEFSRHFESITTEYFDLDAQFGQRAKELSQNKSALKILSKQEVALTRIAKLLEQGQSLDSIESSRDFKILDLDMTEWESYKALEQRLNGETAVSTFQWLRSYVPLVHSYDKQQLDIYRQTIQDIVLQRKQDVATKITGHESKITALKQKNERQQQIRLELNSIVTADEELHAKVGGSGDFTKKMRRGMRIITEKAQALTAEISTAKSNNKSLPQVIVHERNNVKKYDSLLQRFQEILASIQKNDKEIKKLKTQCADDLDKMNKFIQKLEELIHLKGKLPEEALNKRILETNDAYKEAKAALLFFPELAAKMAHLESFFPKTGEDWIFSSSLMMQYTALFEAIIKMQSPTKALAEVAALDSRWKELHGLHGDVLVLEQELIDLHRESKGLLEKDMINNLRSYLSETSSGISGLFLDFNESIISLQVRNMEESLENTLPKIEEAQNAIDKIMRNINKFLAKHKQNPLRPSEVDGLIDLVDNLFQQVETDINNIEPHNAHLKNILNEDEHSLESKFNDVKKHHAKSSKNWVGRKMALLEIKKEHVFSSATTKPKMFSQAMQAEVKSVEVVPTKIAEPTCARTMTRTLR